PAGRDRRSVRSDRRAPTPSRAARPARRAGPGRARSAGRRPRPVHPRVRPPSRRSGSSRTPWRSRPPRRPGPAADRAGPTSPGRCRSCPRSWSPRRPRHDLLGRGGAPPHGSSGGHGRRGPRAFPSDPCVPTRARTRNGQIWTKNRTGITLRRQPSAGGGSMSAPVREGTSLRRSLSVWQAVGLSVALMAPSMAANINPQGTATLVGRATPLAFFLAALAVLLIAYVFVRLCQYYKHAGSVYVFTGASLGPHAGAVAGLGLMGTYVFYALVTSSAAGIFGASFLDIIGVWNNQPEWAGFLVGFVALVLAL